MPSILKLYNKSNKVILELSIPSPFTGSFGTSFPSVTGACRITINEIEDDYSKTVRRLVVEERIQREGQ